MEAPLSLAIARQAWMRLTIPARRRKQATSRRGAESVGMDVPLAGLGLFGGWIVLVVASDVFGILRIPQKRLTVVQTVFLVVAIVGALACGFTYLQERHPRPCPPAPAHTHARR